MKGTTNKKNITNNTIISIKNGINDTEIDGEKVMMDLEKGKYFMINPVGSDIWNIIKEPKSMDEIIKSLLEEYDVDYDTCKKQVMDFIEYLLNVGLIEAN